MRGEEAPELAAPAWEGAQAGQASADAGLSLARSSAPVPCQVPDSPRHLRWVVEPPTPYFLVLPGQCLVVDVTGYLTKKGKGTTPSPFQLPQTLRGKEPLCPWTPRGTVSGLYLEASRVPTSHLYSRGPAPPWPAGCCVSPRRPVLLSGKRVPIRRGGVAASAVPLEPGTVYSCAPGPSLGAVISPRNRGRGASAEGRASPWCYHPSGRPSRPLRRRKPELAVAAPE